LREQLTGKGPKGFILLYRSLKNNDYDADGKLSTKELIKALHDVRTELLDKEIINIFKVFDPSNSGFLSIAEFMNNFIPELNPRRRDVVEEVLDGLEGNSGKLTFATIKKIFNARGHPDFHSGKKTDYDLKDEFFLVLNIFLSLSGGVNDFIPRDVLLQFFEIYSYAYTDDNYFENIMRGIFRMGKSTGFDPKKSTQYPESYENKSVHSQRTGERQSVKNAPFGTDPAEQYGSPQKTKTSVTCQVELVDGSTTTPTLC
jgi:hypothetical protein